MASLATDALGFVFTPEQETLRGIVRTFLSDKCSEADVRRLMASDEGFDRATWSQLAQQLGLTGLAVPEEYGGSGFGFVETAIVLEELGRALAPVPYFASAVLATQTLLHSGDEQAMKQWLPRLASGEIIGTLAFSDANGTWNLEAPTTTATARAGKWVLDGVTSFVIDGLAADLILAVARTSAGPSLFAVAASAAGVHREALAALDGTRKLARITLDGVVAELVGDEGAAGSTLRLVLDLALVGLAADAVGGAQFLLERTVRYTGERYQFGRPIGAFQAVKHRCAEMLLAVESAKTAAYYGAFVAADLDEELPVIAALTKAYCSDAYFKVAGDAIQLHGAIGFTWEHPAHLYYKRAKSAQLLFGPPSLWRERLLQRLGV
nr:acyl-CoA dehydrogenase family protein [Dactylosporangium thailandense]